MIPTTRWCTRQPAGSHVHMPAPICLTRPALTISLCEIASASAGGCFSVGSRYPERRVTFDRAVRRAPPREGIPHRDGAPGGSAFERVCLRLDRDRLDEV